MERRFRPIAPKPTPPPTPMAAAASSLLWRPRKRGRDDHRDLLLSLAVSSSAAKRERTAPPPPPPVLLAAGAAPMVPTTRARRPFMAMPEGLVAGCQERLRSLSLVTAAGSPAPASGARPRVIPVERDLISKLQVPRVIKPRPARPLCTTICIDSSSIAHGGAYPAAASSSPSKKKTAREVEAELELPGALPAIVSGHQNRVHLVNEAYKAMVGQPVCPWLDSLQPGGGGGAGASRRRIDGMVVLDMRTFGPAPPRLPYNTAAGSSSASDAFPCTARISWVHGGGSAIASLTVPCNVEHLTGGGGSTSGDDDYHFIWRFDSSRASIIYCIV